MLSETKCTRPKAGNIQYNSNVKISQHELQGEHELCPLNTVLLHKALRTDSDLAD